jgi:CheY-like chemotaxis protein
VSIVVEDDSQLRSVLAVFFRSIGAEIIHAAADGQEALEALANLQPDLIVTDCQMPRWMASASRAVCAPAATIRRSS